MGIGKVLGTLQEVLLALGELRGIWEVVRGIGDVLGVFREILRGLLGEVLRGIWVVLREY